MPLVSEIVNLYEIAQYLASNDIDDKGLYGGGVNIELPQKIRNIGRSVKRIYEADPNDDTLQSTANFLWTLCGIYGKKASVVVQDAGTISSIITPTAGLPIPIDFIVGVGEYMEDGDSELLLDGTNGNPDFRGYNLSFDRGGQPQYTTNPGGGSSYFSWNRTTGLFTCYPNAATGEPFRLEPSS